MDNIPYTVDNCTMTYNGTRIVDVESAVEGVEISTVTSSSNKVTASGDGMRITLTSLGSESDAGTSVTITFVLTAEGYADTTGTFTVTLVQYLTASTVFERQEQIAGMCAAGGASAASNWLEQSLFPNTTGLEWITGRLALQIILGTTSAGALNGVVQDILISVLGAAGITISGVTLSDILDATRTGGRGRVKINGNL